MKKETIAMIGGGVSLLLLTLFGWLQMRDSKLLDLPTQWLAMSILPIVVALFIGGFISRFKGFGLELESTLRTPVTALDMADADVTIEIPGDDKNASHHLLKFSDEKKKQMKRVVLRSGRVGFYSSHGIETSLRQLPHIEFFEIRSEAGDIICFIPVSLFKKTNGKTLFEIDGEKIDRLISAIEEDAVPSAFPEASITIKVSSEQGLLDVLKAMRVEKAPFAAVESPNGRYLGVVFAWEVERRIADTILAAKGV